jgi:hypothetical protein
MNSRIYLAGKEIQARVYSEQQKIKQVNRAVEQCPETANA